jgi:hypothetical protein
LSQSQIHVTAIWVLTVKCKKARLNRWPGASMCGVGALSSHPTPVTWYRNGRSTQHLRWVIRQTWCTVTNLLFYSKFGVHDILQYYFGTGKMANSQDRFPAIQVSCLRRG